jgi:hypothetical protein
MSTHDLGELGTARPPVDMTFQWFGETIRVSPDAGDLTLIEFLEQASRIDATDATAAMVVVKAFLHGQVDERDWDLLMRKAKENHQQYEDLLTLSKSIVFAVTAFPTGRPSDSSDGPQSTDPKSRAGSFSTPARQVIGDMKGRPDLKMVVWQAEQARAADAAA